MPTPKPDILPTQIRAILRNAGPMVRVKVEWIARRLGTTPEQVLAAADRVGTKSFRMMRIGGVGASLAWA